MRYKTHIVTICLIVVDVQYIRIYRIEIDSRWSLPYYIMYCICIVWQRLIL